MTPAPPIKKLDLLLQAAVFLALGWLGMRVFALLMVPVAGLLVGSALTAFAAGALANVACSRLFATATLADFGLAWNPDSGKSFLTGGAIGAGAAVTVMGIPLLFGLAHFELSPEPVPHPFGAFLLVAVALLFGAAGEEMLFHGYAFFLLARNMGAFATILPVGILFALAHLGNANPNVVGLFNTVLWGILLGYTTWRARALWVPIGIHFGWNLILPLFGVNLSGFIIGLTGYTLRWSVGKLWSGGAYGPEGSFLTTLVVIALFWTVSRAVPDPDAVTEEGA